MYPYCEKHVPCTVSLFEEPLRYIGILRICVMYPSFEKHVLCIHMLKNNVVGILILMNVSCFLMLC